MINATFSGKLDFHLPESQNVGASCALSKGAVDDEPNPEASRSFLNVPPLRPPHCGCRLHSRSRRCCAVESAEWLQGHPRVLRQFDAGPMDRVGEDSASHRNALPTGGSSAHLYASVRRGEDGRDAWVSLRSRHLAQHDCRRTQKRSHCTGGRRIQNTLFQPPSFISSVIPWLARKSSTACLQWGNSL